MLALLLDSQGQNAELDSLRRQAKANHKNAVFKCEQCHAFASYTMIDSAERCLEKLVYRMSPSPELNTLYWLTKATIGSNLGLYNEMIAAYDSAFKVIERTQPSIRIQKRVFLQALEDYSLYVECDKGVIQSQQFLDACVKAQEDSLLMHAYLYRARFTECVEGSERMWLSDIESARLLKNNHPAWSGDFFLELGDLHQYFDRIPEVIDNYLQAEQHYLATDNIPRLFDLYCTFSDAYDFINDYERSKHYVLKALNLPGGPPLKERAHHYNSTAWSYYRIDELDSAMFFLEKSVQAFERLSPGNPEIAYPLGNLGLVYKKLGQLDSAVMYSSLAKDLFQQLNFQTRVAEALNNIANVDFERGRVDTAEARFKRALGIARDYADELEEMNAIEGLIKIYAKSNPKQALAYFDDFLELKLALQGKEEALKTLQVEVDRYEQSNKEKITRLQYEAERQSLELERKNLRIINVSIGLALALMLAGFFYYYWYQHLRMTRTLEEMNAVNQRIISMISHDFRGPLNNIKLSLELLQSEEMNRAEFNTLAKDLYRQSADVSLMFDSFVGWAISQKDGYTPYKLKFQWADVLEEVESISKSLADLKNIRIYIQSHSKIDAETDRMAVSLIFRNLLSNAIKYSTHDSSIEISYEREKDVVVTHIKDHGIGMSSQQLRSILNTDKKGSTLGTNNEYGAGLGLRMVIKYINSLNGSINAFSKEGEGTEFIVTLPIKLKDHS